MVQKKGYSERMKNRPKLIVMDTMNFLIESARKDLDEVLGMIDVLTINDAEARDLSGEYSLVKVAKKILTMGPKIPYHYEGRTWCAFYLTKNHACSSRFALPA